MTQPIAQTVAKAGTWSGAAEPCALDYDARFLRRKVLSTDAGDSFLVDLPHTICQIETGRLLIQRDHVIRDMLEKIGAHVHEVREPFTPEGGAYGHGRTHSHAH